MYKQMDSSLIVKVLIWKLEKRKKSDFCQHEAWKLGLSKKEETSGQDENMLKGFSIPSGLRRCEYVMDAAQLDD